MISDASQISSAPDATYSREELLENSVASLIRRSVASRADRSMEEWKGHMLSTQLIARVRELSGAIGGTDSADPRWREMFHTFALQANVSRSEAHLVARGALSLVRSASSPVQSVHESVSSEDAGELSDTHELATAFRALVHEPLISSLRQFFLREE